MGGARRRARWPLVGRDTELDGVAAAVARGGILVGGPAGVGRTRLLHEVADRAERAGRVVRRITGTAVAHDVPLGAAAHLLPAHLLAPGVAGAALLAHAVAALAADDPLLVVDDAHRLDPTTLGVVEQLARSGAAALVMAVPDGAGDPLGELWRDDLVGRIDLAPLPRDGVDTLLRRVLGGPVGGATRDRLWTWTRGIPRLLREIVEGGRADGSLAARDGLWEWTGPLQPSPRLVAMITARLAGLHADLRAALDLLAVAGPLPVPRLVGLTGRDAVAGLERSGLVEVRRPVDRPGADEVHVTDPLHAAVLVELLPAAAAGLLRHRIVETATGDSPDDVLRTGRMLLDGEATDVDGTVLAAAADVALERTDHELAARLARAAGPAGAGVLTEALAWLGRPADADTAGRAAPDSPRLRAVRALNAEFGLHAARETLLRPPPEDRTGPDPTGLDRATRAVIALHRAEPDRAIALGREVLADPAARPGHPLAGAAAGLALAGGGQARPARAAVDAARAALASPDGAAGPGLGRLACVHALRMTMLHAGDLTEPAPDPLVTDPLATGPAHAAVAALHRGGAALLRGHAAHAAELLTEAAHGLDAADPLDLHALCDAWLARALALAGRGVDAGDRLARVRDPLDRFRAHLDRARVWTEATVAPDVATATALLSAARAGTSGQVVAQAQLLHDAVRIGRSPDAAAPLAELAASLPIAAVRAAADHAAGLADGDPLLVTAAADTFERIGALLTAADTAAHAAELHRRRGERRRSAAAASRAVALARRCGDPATPALAELGPPRLTGRETAVARLAADGLSNQMIARRLVVSVRTVETHLAHAYAKLGVGGRSELPGMLPPP